MANDGFLVAQIIACNDSGGISWKLFDDVQSRFKD